MTFRRSCSGCGRRFKKHEVGYFIAIADGLKNSHRKLYWICQKCFMEKWRRD